MTGESGSISRVARPVSVVIRTLGDDLVAWDKADGRRVYLQQPLAELLASVPPTGIEITALGEQLDLNPDVLAERVAALRTARLIFDGPKVPDDTGAAPGR